MVFMSEATGQLCTRMAKANGNGYARRLSLRLRRETRMARHGADSDPHPGTATTFGMNGQCRWQNWPALATATALVCWRWVSNRRLAPRLATRLSIVCSPRRTPPSERMRHLFGMARRRVHAARRGHRRGKGRTAGAADRRSPCPQFSGRRFARRLEGKNRRACDWQLSSSIRNLNGVRRAMLRVLGQEGGGVHFRGQSSTGKNQAIAEAAG